MEYEYGIRKKRTGEIHRHGMDEEAATEWMSQEEWNGADPTGVFEIVRRPLGDWELVDEEKPASPPLADEFLVGGARATAKLYVMTVLKEVEEAYVQFGAQLNAIRHKYDRELRPEFPFELLIKSGKYTAPPGGRVENA